jgi:hypothetical protein
MVQIAEAQSAQLEVTAGAKVAEPSATPAAPGSPAPVPAEAPPAPAGSSLRTWGWIAGGVGVAGVAAGSVFGLMAISKNAATKQSGGGTCDSSNACDQADKNARDTARTLGDVSTVAFVVGGVGLATGAVLLLVAPSSHASSGVRAYPVVGASDAGLAVEGRW